MILPLEGWAAWRDTTRNPELEDSQGVYENEMREVIAWKYEALIAKAMRSPQIRHIIRTEGKYVERVEFNYRSDGGWKRTTVALTLVGVGVDRHRKKEVVDALAQVTEPE
jgi:hypothetical protein